MCSPAINIEGNFIKDSLGKHATDSILLPFVLSVRRKFMEIRTNLAECEGLSRNAKRQASLHGSDSEDGLPVIYTFHEVKFAFDVPK